MSFVPHLTNRYKSLATIKLGTGLSFDERASVLMRLATRDASIVKE